MTTTTIRAVYQNGVLRPERPLPLAEGTAVEITVAHAIAPDEKELDRRLRDAKTFDEWLEATKLLPSDDGGYDIVAALNEN
ncbi:MAG TPA: antitoxin family protein, partial [Gemmataceae bacterium]|nr:antitoxin family protein [Gemmataceae bacterium]